MDAARMPAGPWWRLLSVTDDLPPLHDVWAVLSATYAGAGSEWGPRIHPGYGLA